MLQARQTVADFEIVRLLGKGGMGEVYEAEQKNPQRSVALKVLAPWLAGDDDALQRFWREANVPAQLDHPGIVRIISMGKTDDGIAYYTMHLVRGVSVTEFIRQGKQPPQPSTLGYSAAGQPTPSQKSADAPPPAFLPAPLSPAPAAGSEHRPPLLQQFAQDRYATLARVGAMAARVLASAHAQGFLHRDVKPSNLMVDHHDHLYLVDFGLTRALDRGADATRTGIVVGTPWYMSPEQAQGKPVDARSDIYSLGITLYEMASGGVGPFTASRENSQSVLEQVRLGMHLPLRTLASDIPRPLEIIIERCIQLKPAKRYQRAIDLAQDLEAFALTPSARVTPSREHRPIRFGKRGLAAAALLGTAALVAAALFLRRGAEPDASVAASNQAVVKALADLPNLLTKKEVDSTKAGNQALPALPEMLKKRILHVPIPLMDVNHDPIWRDARLAGQGKRWLQEHQLCLLDFKGQTLFALDDDPQRHWFRFAIDLNQFLEKDKRDKSAIGVFFGWRPVAEPGDVPHRFYVVQLDEHPLVGFPHGQLTIGIGRIDKGHKLRLPDTQWFRHLPLSKSTLALGKSLDWHHLEIEALEQRVKVTVDDRSVEFDVNWLRQQDTYQNAPDPRGVVGIWGSNGKAFFKNATTMALAK